MISTGYTKGFKIMNNRVIWLHITLMSHCELGNKINRLVYFEVPLTFGTMYAITIGNDTINPKHAL